MTIDVKAGQFVEAGQIPKDAVVVGQTWMHANKSGGPDQRFKDNRQVPIPVATLSAAASEHLGMSSR
jgi:hypothetical protein